MSVLAEVIESVEAYRSWVERQVGIARSDPKQRRAILKHWRDLEKSIGRSSLPTGLEVPRLALPATEDPGEMARWLLADGPPGEFPFLNGSYKEMYLDKAGKQEEPTRLFAGLGLAEDTNRRFHTLTRYQRSVRLSTAFDGPTLYGLDSDTGGVFGKIGEGGVAIDTVEDMERLYSGFELGAPNFSVSMTINAPAPILLAMYVSVARKRHGAGVLKRLRGTIQADILKEVQAQNEIIFPVEASLRFLTDMVAFVTEKMPRWYPISISGYHIAEAGATPAQQAAYTLSNGFTYAELFRERGIPVSQFAPRLSFFLDCGLELEYLALARVCRKLWAIGMRDAFGADARGQLFRLHTQTSGRSLVAASFKNNLTRTAIELILAYINATNSCHSNSADEPFTTPSEEYVRLASHAQSIVLEESGLFKHLQNVFAGSPGLRAVETAVESAILDEFSEIDRLGGVLAATEQRYQRSQIQAAAHRYEQQIQEGIRPIVGVNRYRSDDDAAPNLPVVRTPRERKQAQLDRLERFKKKHRADARRSLDRLSRVVEDGGNVFAELIRSVEHCSLGQITARLHEHVGYFRPLV